MKRFSPFDSLTQVGLELGVLVFTGGRKKRKSHLHFIESTHSKSVSAVKREPLLRSEFLQHTHEVIHLRFSSDPGLKVRHLRKPGQN